MRQVFRGLVQSIVSDGKHGAYAVASCEHLSGSVTFSLKPDSWLEKDWPEPGSYVRLIKPSQKRAGWRANQSYLWGPLDEEEENTEDLFFLQEVINYIKDPDVVDVSPQAIFLSAKNLSFDTLLSHTKQILELADQSADSFLFNFCHFWSLLLLDKAKSNYQVMIVLANPQLDLSLIDVFRKSMKLQDQKILQDFIIKIDWNKVEPKDLVKDLKFQEKEQILNLIIQELEKQATSILEKRKSQYNAAMQSSDHIYRSMFSQPVCLEIHEALLSPRLKVLQELINNELLIVDFRERLSSISYHIQMIELRRNAHYGAARSTTQAIKEMYAEVHQKFLPPSLLGDGLEFVNFNQQVVGYFNGELIGDVTYAHKFRIEAGVVLFEKCFNFDQNITGIQRKIILYAWRSGYKKPRVIYDFHAWDREGAMSLEIIKFDGKEVEVLSSVGEKKHEIKKITLND